MSSSDYLVEPGLSNNIIDLLSTIQDRYKKKLRAAQAVSVSPSESSICPDPPQLVHVSGSLPLP